MTGLAFGFINYNSNDIETTRDYKSTLETTVKIVDENNVSPNPYKIANDLVETLE
jgi:methionine synthase II (cobalamin-independent)